MSPEQAKILPFEVIIEHLNNFSEPYCIGYHEFLTKNRLLLSKNNCSSSQICSVLYPEDKYDLNNKLPSLFFCCPTPVKAEEIKMIKSLNLDINDLIENIEAAKDRLQKFEL